MSRLGFVDVYCLFSKNAPLSAKHLLEVVTVCTQDHQGIERFLYDNEIKNLYIRTVSHFCCI